MNIGELIKARRMELGMTLEEVGAIVGVGKSTVRKWETGMIRNMRRDKIKLLAQALQISPAEFINMGTVNPDMLQIDVTEDERNFIECYRAADPRYQELALELLEEHPRR